MIDSFLNNLNNIDLENQTIVLGVSTGVDSMVLLDLYMKLNATHNFKIVISHINHKRREESDLEEEFIKKFTTEHNLILEVAHLNESDLVSNFQSDARHFRYQVYLDVCKKYNAKYLSLAHHGIDQIETVLMRILRGSSLSGYSGMKIISSYKDITILRPLLTLTKDEIYSYAQKNNLVYFEDASNQSDVYTRNRLRHNVVNSLMEETKNAHHKFLEFGNVLSEASRFISVKRDEYINKFVKKGQSQISFDISSFKALDSFLKKEVLFELLKKYSLSKNQIDEINKIIESDKANIVSIIKNTFSVVKEYNQFIILDYVYSEDFLEIDIMKEGIYPINDILKLNVLKINSNSITNPNDLCYNNCIYLSEDSFPLKLRYRQDGDKICLSKGYRKVKDILIDKKIGVTKRRETLILEDSKKEILWIIGVEKSAKLKNRSLKSSFCLIKITLEGNNNNA